jgi:hypothetical protein
VLLNRYWLKILTHLHKQSNQRSYAIYGQLSSTSSLKMPNVIHLPLPWKKNKQASNLIL